MYNKNPMGLFTEFMRRYFAAMGQTTASQVDPEAWRQMAEDMARKLTEAVDTQASERTPQVLMQMKPARRQTIRSCETPTASAFSFNKPG